jgi:hypothetical protein
MGDNITDLQSVPFDKTNFLKTLCDTESYYCTYWLLAVRGRVEIFSPQLDSYR